MASQTSVDWDALRAEAVAASRHAYAPYSSFAVGAAALVDDGRLVTGCNVENAAYGVGLCAECGLVSRLHLEGGGRLTHFVCVGGAIGTEPVVVSGLRRMSEVLPDAFGPDDLA